MPSQIELRLLNRPDCGLCEDAATLLHRLGLDFIEVNIELDPDLERRYSESIPVLLSGEAEIARAPITEATLKNALAGLVRR